MILRDSGKYYEVDPREWRKRKSFDITVGTGRTDKEAKVLALQGVLALQQNIAAQGLMNNPLLTPQHLYRTMSELVTLSGLGDVEKYFANPDDFQPTPPPPEPMDKAMDIEEGRVAADAAYKAGSLQVEVMKAQISLQKLKIEKAKLLMEHGKKIEDEEANRALMMAEPPEQEEEKSEDSEKESNMEKHMASVSEAISKIGDAIKEFSAASTQNTQSALSMIQKPKRIVRENGRVTRIETD
jgi:hypothetical protein